MRQSDKSKASEPEEPLDVRALPGASGVLPGVPDPVVRLIAASCMHHLADVPDPDLAVLQHRVWASVRDAEYQPGKSVDQLLSQLCLPPVQAIRTILDVLAAAGDLETTLRRERDRIDATLAQLARRRACSDRG